MKTELNQKEQLIARVKKAKEFLKHHNGKDAKCVFFDGVFGAMLKGESLKKDNLWACKTTDKQFTEDLEKFAHNPALKLGHTAEFNRFLKFVDWYLRLGGDPLTTKQIEKAYPKFL
jgi:hypothetical protein